MLTGSPRDALLSERRAITRDANAVLVRGPNEASCLEKASRCSNVKLARGYAAPRSYLRLELPVIPLVQPVELVHLKPNSKFG